MITLSIVSHQQSDLVRHLFADLRRLALPDIEIVLTFNLPEDEGWLGEWADLPIRVVRNDRPLGFGSNHNQALENAKGGLFCVINPDVRLPDASFIRLAETFSDPRVGSCAPLVLSPDGELQDNARRFPTLARLVRRILLRGRGSDYATDLKAEVEWTAGMFIMFRQEAFAEVCGFDERYFMYLEDTDIARRLRQAGWKVVYQPAATVVHDARRASHRSMQHLRWHARSMLRFLSGY